MCEREILTKKVFLTNKDIQNLNCVGENTAYKIIASINATSKVQMKGRCSVDDYIKYFGLNPLNYGRVYEVSNS